MLEKFTYTNSFGETLEFGSEGLYVNENDLRDFAWEITSKNNKISGFKKGIVSKTIPVILKCDSEEEGVELRNRLFEVFEKDVLAKQYGKIHIGDYYLKCYITGSKKTNYLIHKGYMRVSLTVHTDKPSWIKETPINYSAKQPTAGLEYKLWDATVAGEWASYAGTYVCTGIGSATDADITIPAYVNGIPVTTIDGGGYYGEGGFKNCEHITSITLPHGIRYIKNGAFMGCKNLTKINIPDSVENIGQFAFTYCDSLTSIFIPDSVISMQGPAFHGCEKLTIYCEATAKPEGWSSGWVSDGIPVVWGHSVDGDVSSDYLNYPYDYPYDFKNNLNVTRLINPHFVPSNFVLRIYGATSNPSIYIGGHKYSVNVNVERGQYLTIDSTEKTIILSEANGNKVNCFKYRDKNSYIFEKIPNGVLDISSENLFGYELMLLDERSEPKWT